MRCFDQEQDNTNIFSSSKPHKQLSLLQGGDEHHHLALKSYLDTTIFQLERQTAFDDESEDDSISGEQRRIPANSLPWNLPRDLMMPSLKIFSNAGKTSTSSNKRVSHEEEEEGEETNDNEPVSPSSAVALSSLEAPFQHHKQQTKRRRTTTSSKENLLNTILLRPNQNDRSYSLLPSSKLFMPLDSTINDPQHVERCHHFDPDEQQMIVS